MPFLEPLLQWFKNDFMNWMPKSIICKKCTKPWILNTSWEILGN